MSLAKKIEFRTHLTKDSLLSFYQQQKPINVRYLGTKFNTINGDKLISFIHKVDPLFFDNVKKVIESELLTEDLCLLDINEIAVSLNYMQERSSFRPHFDRNKYTFVLYFTDNAAMNHICPPNSLLFVYYKSNYIFKNLMGLFFWCWWKFFPSRTFFNEGHAFIFHARKVFHAPDVKKSKLPRLSLQIAFDPSGEKNSYLSQKYYGF
jgi:hypothetical protein